MLGILINQDRSCLCVWEEADGFGGDCYRLEIFCSSSFDFVRNQNGKCHKVAHVAESLIHSGLARKYPLVKVEVLRVEVVLCLVILCLDSKN